MISPRSPWLIPVVWEYGQMSILAQEQLPRPRPQEIKRLRSFQAVTRCERLSKMQQSSAHCFNVCNLFLQASSWQPNLIAAQWRIWRRRKSPRPVRIREVTLGTLAKKKKRIVWQSHSVEEWVNRNRSKVKGSKSLQAHFHLEVLLSLSVLINLETFFSRLF